MLISWRLIRSHDKMNASKSLRPICLALASLVFTTPLQAQSRADNRAACLSDDSDTSIAACTADINSGQETAPHDLALAYYNRGLSHAHKGDYALAISDYKEAIGLDGNDANFHDASGEAYYNSGDRAAARIEFGAALKIDPDDDVAREDLAHANAN
jgi:Flp pilus assembly protein TadD